MSEQLTYSNPKVQRLRRLLGRRSARLEEGSFVVEGPLLVDAAVAAGWHVEAVFVAEGHWSYRPPDVPVFELGPNVMERVATTEHPQPVLAIVERRVASRSVLANARLVLIGDRIADPGNAGTMLRSAEAAGADAVVFTPGSVDVFNPKVVRSSAGALFQVPVLVDAELATLATGTALVTYGTSARGGTPYDEVDLTAPTAVVVGNEAHGLAADAPVHTWISVPHVGRAESLNVAMAATVVLFEAARQRRRALA